MQIKPIILCASASLALGLAACQKQAQQVSYTPRQKEEAAAPLPSNIKKLNAETKDYIKGKTLAVVLGYGYNDEESVSTITASLNENFGVETDENPELISIYVYPNDFMKGTAARISTLPTLLENKELCGIIIIGAPEGTHTALAKLQDKEESGVLPFPVFSFLSQDDILGSQSVSDFVLDYAQKDAGIDEEAAHFIPADVDITELLNNAVQAMIQLREPLKPDANLAPFVQNIIGKKHKLSHYVDADTRIPARNHFLFE